MSEGENVEKEDNAGKQDQLEKHSLPGTNQASKGPGSCENNEEENRPGEAETEQRERVEKHSLPGTNQAGRGPSTTKRETK
jgi:hypothetical protein